MESATTIINRELPLIKEEEIKVLCTREYDLFSVIKGNRRISKPHLNKLKYSIKQHYLFTIIIVNEKNEIIDGQHRFEVIKELNLPMYYIICEGYGINEVHKLNQNSKTWGMEDYLQAYINLGIQDYIQFKEFRDKYSFKNRVALSIATENLSHSGAETDFKEGKFSLDSWDRAFELAEYFGKIGQLFHGFYRREFVFAIIKLTQKDDFDKDIFMQKLKIQPTALRVCVTVEQYISLIEEIYNYKSQNKVNLRY
jgi:hypothetical protein